MADIIDAAADLIEPEGRWCQHAMARTRGGLPVLPRHQQAYCWCPVGAVLKVVASRQLSGHLPRVALRRVMGSVIADFNDGHTHGEVISAMREAAELERRP